MSGGDGELPPRQSTARLVELRPAPQGADELEAVRSRTRLAVVRWAPGEDGVRALVVLDPTSAVSVEDVYGVAAALAHRAASQGFRRLLVASSSVVVRHALREHGASGRLRDPVELDLGRPVQPPERPHNRAERSALLTRALTEFGITVTPVRRPGPLGRLTGRLVGGVSDTIGVRIGGGPGRPFTLSVPDRPDLMPEGVARIADTAVSVIRRFPTEAGSLRAIAVDRSERGLVHGSHSGVAELQQSTIHLHFGHVLAYPAMALHAQRAAETSQAMERGTAQRLVTGGPQLPFVAADATTAHEMWHVVEAIFELKRFKETAAKPGQWIAISGVGGLGHLAIEYAKIMGLHICAIDIDDGKLAHAKRLGADITINAKAGDPAAAVKKATGGGAHGVLITAPSLSAFNQGVGMTRKRGTCVLVGLPPGEFPIPLFDVAANCITIRGSFVGTRQDMAEALAFAADGKVKADIELQPLSAINRVFDRLEHGDVASRVVLEFASR